MALLWHLRYFWTWASWAGEACIPVGMPSEMYQRPTLMTAIGNADKVCHHPFWILKNQYSLNIQVLKFTHDLNVSTDQMDFFFLSVFSSRLCPHRSNPIIFKMFMWKPSLSCLGKPYEKLSICQSQVSHWGGEKWVRLVYVLQTFANQKGVRNDP